MTPSTLDQAAHRAWDVIVVGAGPAGSTAAAWCARAGLEVLLVDKRAFPKHKACGGCLSPGAMQILDELGVARQVGRLGAPISSLQLLAGDRSAELPLATGGIAISRFDLDAILVRHAADAGATLLQNCAATLHEPAEPAWTLRLTGPDAACIARSRLVIVADGLAGTCLPRDGAWAPRISPKSRFGVGTIVENPASSLSIPREHVVMACGRAGYVGLVRLVSGAVDLAAALDIQAARTAGGPAPLIRSILEECGFHVELQDCAWHATPQLTRRRPVEENGILVAGDAAGYVEPFTGEGIFWSLWTSRAIARHARKIRDGTYIAGAWAREWSTFMSRRRFAGTIAAYLLRRNALVKSAIVAMDRVPWLWRTSRRALGGPWAGRTLQRAKSGMP